MTARVTTLKGAEAGAYYVEALPNYYLDSGEPAGVWHGRGAAVLDLNNEIGDDDFLNVMGGRDPRTGQQLGRAYGEQSVRGFDITASAPKSVSVLFAVGDAHTRGEVLAGHDAAVAAMTAWLEAHAHTRHRINGQIAVVDAEGIIAAAFRQHTSRALDPQIHTHVVVANKVRAPDGRWLALDARTLKLDQRTLSAIYHATLRSELTGRLGVTWGPVINGIADIAGIPDIVLEEFSARTGDIQRRLDVKLDRFRDTLQRDPTRRERWRLEREAVLDSRPAKSHSVDAATLHARWTQQLEAIDHDPSQLIGQAVDRTEAKPLSGHTAAHVIHQAVLSLSEKQSTWRPAELTREIAAALPTDLHLDAGTIGDVLDRLSDEAIRQYCLDLSRPIPSGATLRRDGRPTSESVADRALTTPAILAQEERLLAWAERRFTRSGNDSVAAVERADVALTGPQSETAAAVAGDADLVLVVGPAGTGKTTALAPAVGQLQAEGRAVFGVAPSAGAADVLATETGVAADTVDKLLVEHALDRPPHHRYDLPMGATIIVDEAGMVPTDRLDTLAQLADTRGWRLALVGDPQQFSAVGRGGMFAHLIDTYGAIELDQVHRFTHEWERAASLRLRRGDPTAAGEYDRHGRLHGGTAARMESDALDAWEAARCDGETVLLTAPTNDTVHRLNEAAQRRRITAGELDSTAPSVTAGDHRLHVGDEIVTRRNQRQLRTDRGHMVRNRDTWTIAHVHRNGDLTVDGPSGRTRLPAHYVRAHVELGYAQTSHASQGRTVDRSILLLDSPTDIRGIYVPMTRGRHHNDAYIVTTDDTTALDIFTQAITSNWIDRPALARQIELTGINRHRPGTLPLDELRTLLAQRAELTATLTRLHADLHRLPHELRRARDDQRRAITRLEDGRERHRAATEVLAAWDRPLRRRGHQHDIEAARRALDQLPDEIRGGAAAVEKQAELVGQLEQQLRRAEQLNLERPALEAQLDDIEHRLDEDRDIRSRQVRRQPVTRIIATIGPRPLRGEAARTWDHAAGQLDQHLAAYGLIDEAGPKHEHAWGFLHSRDRCDDALRRIQAKPTRRRDVGGALDGPDLSP